jgi:uncharacterized protein YndB with AHSA1/START domain
VTTLARAQAVVVTRELPAPPERVFEWLTDADKLARWMTPEGQAFATAEAVVGGRLSITMISGEVRIEHRGAFVEIQRPNRLVFTWISPYTDGESLVTIDLAGDAKRTVLTLRHERLPIEHADAHAGGWGSMLDRLAGALKHGG